MARGLYPVKVKTALNFASGLGKRLKSIGTYASSSNVGLNYYLLTKGGAGSTASAITSATTESIAPIGNALVTLSINVRNSASIQPTTPTVVGNGLTWVLVQKINYETGAPSLKTLFVFRALAESPTSGTIVITFGETNTNADWVVEQWTGVDRTGTNGSGAIRNIVTRAEDNNGTPVTSTNNLGAFASPDNGTYIAWAWDNAGPLVSFSTGFSPGGFSVTGTGGITANNVVTGWSAQNLTTNVLIVTNPSNIGGIAFEVVKETAVSNNLVATLAISDSPDVANIVTSVTTGASIAAVDGADSANIAAIVTSVTNANIAATDGADVANVATSVTTGVSIAALDGADIVSMVAENWTTASIAASDSPDDRACSNDCTYCG